MDDMVEEQVNHIEDMVEEENDRHSTSSGVSVSSGSVDSIENESQDEERPPSTGNSSGIGEEDCFTPFSREDYLKKIGYHVIMSSSDEDEEHVRMLVGDKTYRIRKNGEVPLVTRPKNLKVLNWLNKHFHGADKVKSQNDTGETNGKRESISKESPETSKPTEVYKKASHEPIALPPDYVANVNLLNKQESLKNYFKFMDDDSSSVHSGDSSNDRSTSSSSYCSSSSLDSDLEYSPNQSSFFVPHNKNPSGLSAILSAGAQFRFDKSVTKAHQSNQRDKTPMKLTMHDIGKRGVPEEEKGVVHNENRCLSVEKEMGSSKIVESLDFDTTICSSDDTSVDNFPGLNKRTGFSRKLTANEWLRAAPRTFTYKTDKIKPYDEVLFTLEYLERREKLRVNPFIHKEITVGYCLQERPLSPIEPLPSSSSSSSSSESDNSEECAQQIESIPSKEETSHDEDDSEKCGRLPNATDKDSVDSERDQESTSMSSEDKTQQQSAVLEKTSENKKEELGKPKLSVASEKDVIVQSGKLKDLPKDENEIRQTTATHPTENKGEELRKQKLSLVNKKKLIVNFAKTKDSPKDKGKIQQQTNALSLESQKKREERPKSKSSRKIEKDLVDKSSTKQDSSHSSRYGNESQQQRSVLSQVGSKQKIFKQKFSPTSPVFGKSAIKITKEEQKMFDDLADYVRPDSADNLGERRNEEKNDAGKTDTQKTVKTTEDQDGFGKPCSLVPKDQEAEKSVSSKCSKSHKLMVSEVRQPQNSKGPKDRELKISKNSKKSKVKRIQSSEATNDYKAAKKIGLPEEIQKSEATPEPFPQKLNTAQDELRKSQSLKEHEKGNDNPGRLSEDIQSGKQPRRPQNRHKLKSMQINEIRSFKDPVIDLKKLGIPRNNKKLKRVESGKIQAPHLITEVEGIHIDSSIHAKRGDIYAHQGVSDKNKSKSHERWTRNRPKTGRNRNPKQTTKQNNKISTEGKHKSLCCNSDLSSLRNEEDEIQSSSRTNERQTTAIVYKQPFENHAPEAAYIQDKGNDPPKSIKIHEMKNKDKKYRLQKLQKNVIKPKNNSTKPFLDFLQVQIVGQKNPTDFCKYDRQILKDTRLNENRNLETNLTSNGNMNDENINKKCVSFSNDLTESFSLEPTTHFQIPQSLPLPAMPPMVKKLKSIIKKPKPSQTRMTDGVSLPSIPMRRKLLPINNHRVSKSPYEENTALPSIRKPSISPDFIEKQVGTLKMHRHKIPDKLLILPIATNSDELDTKKEKCSKNHAMLEKTKQRGSRRKNISLEVRPQLTDSNEQWFQGPIKISRNDKNKHGMRGKTVNVSGNLDKSSMNHVNYENGLHPLFVPTPPSKDKNKNTKGKTVNLGNILYKTSVNDVNSFNGPHPSFVPKPPLNDKRIGVKPRPFHGRL